jgi:hypothetical protein
MNKNSLTTAVIAGLAGVAGIANMASAVNLNPDGLGQVLLYPYYTVNNSQETQLSVVNTTSIAKAVKVRFLEGYNSREVLDFNLFLSPFDVWTASVFPLSVVSPGATAAAIATGDNSCTAPEFAQGTINGLGYQQFLNYAYVGTNADSGPEGLDRTREGHFEMISMADLGGAVAVDVTHVNGVPKACSSAEADFIAGDLTFVPTSGLFGSAAVVNVAQGTYYSYTADAVDGFTSVILATATGDLRPSLLDVNDAGGTTATSYVFDDGALLTSPYSAGGLTGVDAVSSLFMASNVYNEYEADGGFSGTDWVVNFPTKRFYVDPGYVGTTSSIQPFEEFFGQNEDGLSCAQIGITIYDREEKTSVPTGCGFSPCPPGQPASSLCHETNVITFNSSGTNSILGSTLNSNIVPIAGSGAGWVGLNFQTSASTTIPHLLRAAINGNVFAGLPINGFQATNFVNGNVGGVLSNYSGAFRHRISRLCTNGVGACS